ncbi:hypothetical protein [Pseudomonas cerasi]
MTLSDAEFDHENLFLLKRALTLVDDLELGFKNRTALATLCAHFMSAEKPGSRPISISTLTRNPIYRSLLDTMLAKRGDGRDMELLALKLEISNLRKANRRKDLYIASLDNPPLEQSTSEIQEKAVAVDLTSNYLVKIIDLLLDCFYEHIVIDPKSAEFVRPYFTSSGRVVVPNQLAKHYLKFKHQE